MSLTALEGLFRADAGALAALRAVRDVGPVGAYIAAGFVRNRYWDSLYAAALGAQKADLDVVYFDAAYNLKTRDMAFEASLHIALPGLDWQVRNQARMHDFHGFEPFTSLEDGLRHWAETATGVGVRLGVEGEFEWVTAFGFDDLFGHILRITPAMRQVDPKGFDARLAAKGWLRRWPKLTVIRD